MRPTIALVAAGILAVSGFGAGYLFRGVEVGELAQAAELRQGPVRSKVLELEQNVAQLTKERDHLREDVEQERERAAKEMVTLTQRLAEADAKAGKLADALARQSATQNRAGMTPLKAMGEMMKAPAMKEAIKQQQIAMMDLHYGKLFERFHLSDAEKQDFKELLGERLQRESELGVLAMSGEATPQQIQENAKRLNEEKAAIDQKIKAFLNNESDYQAYANWEKTKPERMTLSMAGGAFASAGEPLSAAQEEQLVEAMFSARSRVVNLPDLTKMENITPDTLSPQMLEKFMASYDSQASEVLQSAGQFLSPKQLEALKTMQQGQRGMQELGLKMTAGMLGNKK